MLIEGIGLYSCFPLLLVAVHVGLACVDGIIAFLAFYQLIRIHSRNSQLGWTRQKVFHLLIGSSNICYFVYFLSTPAATCKWLCWSYSCGFIVMGFPRILLFAAFLLLLSFWVDLCHEADDEDEEDDHHGFLEALLKKSLSRPTSSNGDNQRVCCSFRSIHVGSRQKIVIWVTVLLFVLMMTFAVLIWIAMGSNPIDPSTMARIYVNLFAVAILILGGALACYGFLLCQKMRKVKSERVSSEIHKVTGLAVVSVVCFTSSSLVSLLTDVPVFYQWDQLNIDGLSTSLLLILYYFIGSSVPSTVVLWVMRELPPLVVANTQQESRTITFVSGSSAAAHHRPLWTKATSSQNQISRGSPI